MNRMRDGEPQANTCKTYKFNSRTSGKHNHIQRGAAERQCVRRPPVDYFIPIQQFTRNTLPFARVRGGWGAGRRGSVCASRVNTLCGGLVFCSMLCSANHHPPRPLRCCQIIYNHVCVQSTFGHHCVVFELDGTTKQTYNACKISVRTTMCPHKLAVQTSTS